MRSTQYFGPNIVTLSGGYYNHPPTYVSDSGQPLWSVHEYNNFTKRPKPVGYGNPTGAQAFQRKITRGILTDSFGNRSPSPYSASEPVPPADYVNSVADEAIAKCLQKVKGETWNLSVFVAEMPQTKAFMSEVLGALWKSYRAVKRGDVRSLRRMWFPRRKGNYQGGAGKPITDNYWNIVGKPYGSAVAGKWLEWRYAVSPMIYDLDDALKEVVGRSKVGEALTYIRRSGSATGHYNALTRTATYLHSQDCSFKQRACIVYRVDANAAAFKRLGLINLASTLWEVTPFSFVVDRLIPVGRTLSNLDAMAGVTVVEKTISLSQSSVASASAWASNGTWNATESTFSKRLWSRTVGFSAVPSPPQFQPDYNLLHQFDAAALLFQQLGRRT